jgi:exodeoxyribonuclease V gamma subunit
VRAWAAGQDADAHGAPLPAERRWQAELWRALRERIGAPGPAERLEPACARLIAKPGLLALPERLAVFGLTRLPAGEVRVLRALAERREVHLFLLHPSPALWEALTPLTPPDGARLSRHADPSAEQARHPLLASWGRDARELQLVLGRGSGSDAEPPPPPAAAPATLLARIQAGILADTAPADGAERPPLHPHDRSIEIHACHGRARQVEVLRDAVLGLLAADPGLEPRDIVVMCPDVEAFAPLIQATFGAGEPERSDDDAARIDLRVRLADRALRQTNPVLAALSELLALAGDRLTASQVLGFADREPVRRRFGLRDEDLTRLQRWVSDAGVRWGLDAAHRAPFKLGALPQGTWQAGLERLLLGVTMTEEGSRLFAGVLPLDDVESGAIELAGRLAELIARLGAALDSFAGARPIGAWTRALAEAIDSLTATSGRDAWQRAELQRILDQAEAEAAGGEVPLELPEIRALLAARLAGHPTRANFRTGHLTVCTLYPMRSVPHRVVCLLGLDDGAFPRRSPRDGDDLLLADPHVGERDPRSEDRQLLLDALMAATERLLVIYTGSDERTNLARPPAVPIGELLDTIDATVAGAGGAPARDQVVHRHPLQPFDARNFTPGALIPGRPWSFDPVMLAGARALGAARGPAPPFLADPLPPTGEEVIELEDLIQFLQAPVKAFLRQRLRVVLGDVRDEVEDRLPVELDGLERWGVGQRMLEAMMAGVEGQASYRAEIARGTLPPGALGLPVVRALAPQAAAIRNCAREHVAGRTPAALDIHLTLPDGRLLSGIVPEVWDEVLLSVTFSRLGPKHRLAAWARLLAASAAVPERALHAVTVARGRGDDGIALARIAPLHEEPGERRRRALEQLGVLVDLYGRGMREPLPLACQSSAAWAFAVAAGEPPGPDARRAWESGYRFDGEDTEPDHRLAFGGERPFEHLLAQAPRADESGPGWDESEPTRFGRLARRLWDGLIAHEELRWG